MAKTRIAPVHPGIYLKELLEELELSQYRLARDIGVPAMRISHIVHGTRPVTAELALRLGRYFGQSPRYWLNLQSRYDMDVTEDEIGKRVTREVRPHKKDKSELKDWLRPEYKRSDFGELVRGKYASRIRTATNIVVLDPQVAKVFPNDEAVNNALRGLIELARSSARLTVRSSRSTRKRTAA
jgi:addiction module HigA family antidote